jgi:hypothetical protein
MCDDCHLTALAAFAVKHSLTAVRDVDLNEAQSIDRVRIMLGRENVASLRARYGKQDDYVGTSCPHAKANTFDPAAIVKACDCYSYQACEHSGWQMSPARLLIQKIRLAALSLAGWNGRDPAELDIGSKAMPGYNEAAWGLDCAHDLAPIVEDRDDYHARWLAECRDHGECKRQLADALELLRRHSRAAALERETRAFIRKVSP